MGIIKWFDNDIKSVRVALQNASVGKFERKIWESFYKFPVGMQQQ